MVDDCADATDLWNSERDGGLLRSRQGRGWCVGMALNRWSAGGAKGWRSRLSAHPGLKLLLQQIPLERFNSQMATQAVGAIGARVRPPTPRSALLPSA